MNILTEYIKYRWNAKKRHGIHSPFVYELSDRCNSIALPHDQKQQLSMIIKSIDQSTDSITVTDLGAGSLRMSDVRPVRKALQHSSSKGTCGEVLYKLCKHYKPKNILELGTSLGIGTWHMNRGNPAANLISVEGCPQTLAAMQTYVSPYLNENVHVILSSFDSFLETSLTQSIDFIFIDGHHDGQALVRYIRKLLPFSHDETIFVLDDIRWSNSMYDAWKKLIKDDTFHVSIDLFRMGLLIQKPTQEKEHFILRL